MVLNESLLVHTFVKHSDKFSTGQATFETEVFLELKLSSNMHAHRHTHTHTRARLLTRKHTNTHTNAHTQARTYLLTHTDTNTHMYATPQHRAHSRLKLCLSRATGQVMSFIVPGSGYVTDMACHVTNNSVRVTWVTPALSKSGLSLLL